MSESTGQTPETQNAQAEPANQGSLDAAALALSKALSLDEPETETEPPEDDSAEEPSDGEPEADTEPEVELVEVVIGGKTFSMDAETAAEVEKATLRQAEFSRKMNEVSAKDKATTQRTEVAERLYEGAEKFAEAKAEVKLIETQLKQYEKVNWQQIRAQNPAEYAALATDLQNLRLSKANAEAQLQNIDGEIARAKDQAFATKREEMVSVLAKELKGWGNEMGEALTRYAVENHVDIKTLQGLTDPGVVIAIEKARKFDALQKGKTELKAKAKEAPPVLKPGAPRKANPQVDAMAVLRKTNTSEAAEAALLSRMK